MPAIPHDPKADIQLIRNLLLRAGYEDGLPVLKELLQNADDAGSGDPEASAKNFWVVLAPQGLQGATHPLLKDRAGLCILNDGDFKETDATCLPMLGLSSKAAEQASVGKFGIGLKTVFFLSEVFFFFSHREEDWSEAKACELVNPWGQKHRQPWEEVWTDDARHNHRELFRDWGTRILQHAGSPHPSRFVGIWIPLRLQADAQPDVIHSHYPTPGFDAVFGTRWAERVQEFMPLLRHVRNLRAQVLHHDGQLEEILQIAPAAPGDAQFMRVGAGDLKGGFELRVGAHDPTTLRFCGREFRETEEFGKRFQNHPKKLWPRQAVFGDAPDQLERATPHGAVVFTRRPALAKNGLLLVQHAVFLPLSETERKTLPGGWDYCLFLHGFYFVDSSRRHIERYSDLLAATYLDTVSSEEEIRKLWNRTLVREVIAPLLLPSLETFVGQESMDAATTGELVTALASSATLLPLTKSICRGQRFIPRLKKADSRWVRQTWAEAGGTPPPWIELPAPGFPEPELFNLLPSLEELSTELAVSLAGTPRLAEQKPARPDDGQLARLLARIPVSIFDNADHLAYLLELVPKDAGERGPDSPLTQALVALTNQVISRRLPEDNALTEHWARLFQRLPTKAIVRLPVESAKASPEIAKTLEAASLPVALLWQDYRDATGTGMIPWATLLPVLKQLSALVLDQEEVVKQRSDVVVRLLKAAAEQTEAWKSQIENLPLFACREPGGTARVTSLGQLQVAGTAGRLFTSGESCAQDLVKAAPELKPLMAMPDVAEVLKLTAPNCDLAACVRLLKTASRLAADFVLRKPLFERLLREARPKEQSAWATLRCLLHGEVAAWQETATLFDESGAAPVLLKLFEKALAASEQPWRCLPANVIGQLGLNAEHRQQLRLVAAADDATIEALLWEVGPASVDCSGLSTEDCDFILERFNDVEVLRGLNIHETVDGDRVLIGPHTYVDDGTFQDLPAMCRVTRLRDRPGYARFRDTDGFRRLNWEAVIEIEIDQPNPAQQWNIIFTAVGILGTLRPEVRERVQRVAWLPLAVGSAVEPSQLLDLPGAEAELDRLPPEVLNSNVPLLRLAMALRQHDRFSTFRHALLPSGKAALDRLANLLNSHSDWSTGLAGEWTADQVSDWVKALGNASETALRVASLVKAMHGETSVRELLPDFLHSISRQLAETKYAEILKHLAELHGQRGCEDHPMIERVFLRYLRRINATSADFARRVLLETGVRLLSQAGEWRSPGHLAFACDGLPRQACLCTNQGEALSALWPPDHVLVAEPEVTLPQTHREFEKLLEDTPQVLRTYFTEWRDEVASECVGAFLSVLGDHTALVSLSKEFLGNRSMEAVRQDFEAQSEPPTLQEQVQHYRTHGGALPGVQPTLQEQFRQCRFACVPHDSRHVKMLSIIGTRFSTQLEGRPQTLFLGDGLEIDSTQPGGWLRNWSRRTLHLSPLRPQEFTREELSQILLNSTTVILHKIYRRRELRLESLWRTLSQSGQLHIRIAQNRVVDAAQAFLRQVGAHRTAEVQEVLKSWDSADRLRAEAEESGRAVPTAVQIKMSELKRRLRDLLAGHAATQQGTLAAVRNKIEKDYGYKTTSVPFEVWQNADDALVQLGLLGHDNHQAELLGFVVKSDSRSIAFAHWGRLINEFHGPDGRDYRERGFDKDLENMVVQAISDKRANEQSGEAVTGKFGLGFKSVFLVTDAPEVLSGSVDFGINGGIYPVRLNDARRTTLENTLRALARAHWRRGTVIRLPLRTDAGGNADEVLSLFRRLAPLLVVFSRRLKRLRLRAPDEEGMDVCWQPHKIGEEIHIGALEPLDGGRIKSALVLSRTLAGDRVEFLLGLDANGFVPLPDWVPVFWVTAPTRATPDYGFAVNGPFEPDVGRVQLALQSEKNKQLAGDLAGTVSNRLGLLWQLASENWENLRHQLGLATGTTKHTFWESLWQVLGCHFAGKWREDKSNPAPTLARRILWASEADGLQSFYRACTALPTGLPGEYRALTRLPELRFLAAGALDHEPVFEVVSRWLGFRQRVPMERICSERNVASTLERLGVRLEAEPVRLADVIQWELGENRMADPELAAKLGQLITPQFLKTLHEGKPSERDEREWEALGKLLGGVRVQAADGSWHKPTDLVVAEGAGVKSDETQRAAFAPQECRLNPAYTDTALGFYLACRPNLETDVERMAAWVLQATGEEARVTALRYLLDGELKGRLAEALRRRSDNTNWLWQLAGFPWFGAHFTAEEQHQIRAYVLRLFDNELRQQTFPPPVHPPLPQPEPVHVWTVEELWKWWEQRGKPMGDYTLEGKANWDLFHGGPIGSTEERRGELKRLLLSVAKPDGNPEGNALWYRLFGYACLLSAGRQATELRDFWKERLSPNRFWERTSAGDFSEETKDLFTRAVTAQFTNLNAGGEAAYFWRRVFYDVRKIRRMVCEHYFPATLMDLVESGHGPHLPHFLRTGFLPGPDQSRWVGTFGQSAGSPLFFVIRELVRLEVITDPAVRSLAYFASTPVRRALRKIGWIDEDDAAVPKFEEFASLSERLHNKIMGDPEFGPKLLPYFDIPLLHMGITHRGDKMPVPPH